MMVWLPFLRVSSAPCSIPSRLGFMALIIQIVRERMPLCVKMEGEDSDEVVLEIYRANDFIVL